MFSTSALVKPYSEQFRLDSTALANARDLADWLGIGQVHHTLVSALG